MTQWFLLVLIVWCVFIAAMMAFSPQQVLKYAKSSRMWMWYLTTVFNITKDSMSSSTAIRWVRTQGVIGLVVASIALYAWMRAR